MKTHEPKASERFFKNIRQNENSEHDEFSQFKMNKEANDFSRRSCNSKMHELSK
jgi:hypothetical protein